MYFSVRSREIKIAFHRMSSPVLFMPQDWWHMGRIIISEKQIYLPALERPCSSYSGTCLAHRLSVNCQWRAEGKESCKGIRLELKQSHFVHFIWCVSFLGSLFLGALHANLAVIWVSVSYPLASWLRKCFFFLASFLRKNKILWGLICAIQTWQAAAAQWRDTLLTPVLWAMARSVS